MIFISIDNFDTINKFCHICEKYKEAMYIDVVHGRYTVDGGSVLGVTSLMGHIVKVIPSTSDLDLYDMFYKEIEKIGAYKV